MSNPTRWPYGKALGWVNQFVTYGPPTGGTSGLNTAGLISGSATPDVTNGDLFIVNNTGTVTITYFNLQNYAYSQQNYSGKVISVMVLDQGSTQFANSGQLFLFGTDNLATNSSTPFALYEFVHFNSAWYQNSASKTGRNDVTILGTNAGSSLNVNGVRYAVLNNTGSTTNKIMALSGGQVGQEITFSNIGSNAIMFIFQAGGGTSSNMVSIASNSMLINASGAYKFIKGTDLLWRPIVIGSANYGA